MADIVRWDPFSDLMNFRSSFDRIFDEMMPFRARGLGREYELNVPIDMFENNEEIVVKALIPGIKPTDLDINVVGNLLTIRGQMREELESDEQNYYRREVRSGTFLRQVSLPTEVVADKAQATYEDGVLRLRLPKAEEAKAKSIQIQARNVIEGGQAGASEKGAPKAGEKGSQGQQVNVRQGGGSQGRQG